METLWFCLAAVILAGYVVLDGYDLGAGIIHLTAARTETERQDVLKSIGPFWDGNEVWLLAAGGTLFFAFPVLYASSFSGFYLPLMIVLWLLILRGISIEFRNHIDSATWKPLWDVVFCGASGLLAIFYGAALGNVIRGVPLDKEGEFFLPLWTDFRISAEPGILDWYTILTGLLAFFTITLHGALWVRYRTTGDLARKANRTASLVWSPVAILTIGVTFASFSIQPQIARNFADHSWGAIFPVIALAGLIGTMSLKRELATFLASSAFIAGMLCSAAFGIFPMVLPSVTVSQQSLTIYNTSASPYGFQVGLIWWVPGMLLAVAYAYFLHRRFAGKVMS